MPKLLSKKEKAEIMGRLLPLAEDYDQSTAQLEAFVEEGRTGAEISELERQLTGMDKEIQELLGRYLEGIPVRDLSRCPFTGEKVSLAIDDLGLDGLWWNYDAPKRPENELPNLFRSGRGTEARRRAGKGPFLPSRGRCALCPAQALGVYPG